MISFHLVHYLVLMLSHNNFSPVIVDVGDGEALKELILRAKKGDAESFSLVYKTLYTPLYRYVISKCHDEELANDTVSQTFLKFYEALENYEPEKSPLAYLFTIAKRLLINHSEKKTFESLDETYVDGYEDVSKNTIDEAHISHLSSIINTYIPSLSPDEQEVVRLFFYAELSHKEIAEVLLKEEASVRKIKERALKKLRILTNHLNEKQ